MDIHKPKPVYDWRGFLGEVGIVVFGVLIALGAQQVVDKLQWQQDIGTGTEALRQDARYLVQFAAQRQALSPCLGRRLAAVGLVLDTASARGRLPAVGQIGAPPRVFYAFATWDAMLASQVATHMQRKQMLAYAEVAKGADAMSVLSRNEFAAWTDLYTIVGPGRRLGDAEQANVRLALSRAVLAGKHMLLGAESVIDVIEESGLLAHQEVVAIRRKVGEQYVIDARDGIMCKPLEDAPKAASYGQAPSRTDLEAPFSP